jgi:hypothetical protein
VTIPGQAMYELELEGYPRRNASAAVATHAVAAASAIATPAQTVGKTAAPIPATPGVRPDMPSAGAAAGEGLA